MSVVFEDRETLRYQIQEMTRVDPGQVEAWKAGAGSRLRIDHANYAHEMVLSPETRSSLARELQERSGVARVQLDLLAGEPGQLRLELTALR